MPASIGYDIVNEKEFTKKLTDAFEKTKDLRVPFSLIRADFYKDQKRIFLKKGRGRYPDLSPKYKKRKQLLLGFAYPILRGINSHVGAPSLESSITKARDVNAINIITKSSLTLGTKVEYGIYHQSDRPPRSGKRKIPLRKFLFIDGKFVAQGGPGDVGFGRVQRWLSILDDHLLKQTKAYSGKS